eukprot:768697-Hanusia_phi.AAC.5
MARPTLHMERWAELDRRLEEVLGYVAGGIEGELPEGLDMGSLMEEWLTQSSPAEPVDAELMLNRMHLMGTVLARLAYLLVEEDGRTVQAVVPGCKPLEISDTPVDRMGWRELQSAIDNLQIHWREACALPGARDLCWKLFARFGCFVAYAVECEGGGDGPGCPLDIFHDRQECPEAHPGAYRLADTAMIQALDAFFSMFRYLWLLSHEERAGDNADPSLIDLRPHHFEAATDTYHLTTMHDDIHIGALTQYRHRFAGMYNTVSQVAYFQNPVYQRRRAPMSAADLAAQGRTAADALPVLQQLYPELRLYHEDADLRSLPANAWCWLHAPGRVWLVQPPHRQAPRRFLWNPSPVALLATYIARDPSP